MAPGYYLNGNPSETDPVTRQFERVLGNLTIDDPYLNQTVPLSVGLADRASMKLLHMVSGDPLRTPTVVSWNESNAWVQTGNGTPVSINPAFAWVHGGIQPEIAQTCSGSSARASSRAASTTRRGPTTPMCGRRSWPSWDWRTTIAMMEG